MRYRKLPLRRQKENTRSPAKGVAMNYPPMLFTVMIPGKYAEECHVFTDGVADDCAAVPPLDPERIHDLEIFLLAD